MGAKSDSTGRRVGQGGFTLLELMISMAILGLMAAAISGVIVLGANSAGSGERVTEQARRLRVATGLITRQLHSTSASRLETEDQMKPFFLGYEDSVEFVTSIPQRADVSGLAIVRYWLEDGTLKMSEFPLFAAAGEDFLEFEADEAITLETTLMYDIDELIFSYRRSSDDSDDWEDTWDADEDDELPAAVRIEVTPATDDGPRWFHEVPVMVAAYNELSGQSDYQRGRGRLAGGRGGRNNNNDDDDDDADEDDDFDDEDDEDDD